MPEETLNSVKWLLRHYRDYFKNPTAALASWTAWAANHPLRVEDVIEKPSWVWPPACKNYSKNLPVDLITRTKTFAETIEFKNVINGKSLAKAQCNANLDEYR